MGDNGCLELGGWHWRLSSWKPWCVFTRKANLNASSHSQVTRGGFFLLFAVDLFIKYSALGLDDVADNAWVGDILPTVQTPGDVGEPLPTRN